MRQLTACERQLAACERQLAACERQLAVGPRAQHARTAGAERSNRGRGTMAELHLRTAKCPLRVVGAGDGARNTRTATMDAPIFCPLDFSLLCPLFTAKKILPEVRLLRYFGRISLRSETPLGRGISQREGFLLFWCEEFFRFYLRSRRMASLRPAFSAERM